MRRFLIRRGFKIWPAYYVFVTYLTLRLLKLLFSGSALLQKLSGQATDRPVFDWSGVPGTLMSMLPNWIHLQNYLGATEIPGTRRGHTWSLSVEEHFYLALPLLLFLVTRRRKHPIRALPEVPVIAALLVVGCTYLRSVVSASHGPFSTVVYPSHLRIDGLFFGVMLSYAYHFHPQLFARVARCRVGLALFGAACVSPMIAVPLETPFVLIYGLPLLYIGYGCILLAMVPSPVADPSGGIRFAGRHWKAVAFIGFHSYSIYLWHMECQFALKGIRHPLLGRLPGDAAWLLGTLLYVALSIAVGVALGRLIEMRALALRDRLFPARAAAWPAAAAQGSTGALVLPTPVACPVPEKNTALPTSLPKDPS